MTAASTPPAPDRTAAPSQPATATISTALLIFQPRIAREPLVPWARRLAGILEEARRDQPPARELARVVMGAANNVSLIAASQGDHALAWRICEAQLRWQHRLGERAGDPGIAGGCVDPWVNLGRLESLAGRWEPALARFAALAAYRGEGRLRLGEVAAEERAWELAHESREAFEHLLDVVYVTDSLKALLLNRRFSEVAAFVDALSPERAERLGRFAREARIVAAGRLGDTEPALELAYGSLAGARGWDRVVYQLRAAEVWACAGELERAASLLAPMASSALRLGPEQMGQPQVLAVLLRIAGACAEAGLETAGAAVARAALDGSRAARDEPFEIESLVLLAAHAPPPERAAWRDELDRLRQNTLYRRYRLDGAADPGPVLERLYGMLAEVLES